MKISNKTNVSDPTIFLNSQPLIQSRTFKYLGIHIDNTLKFYTQVEHIQTKLYQLSGITFRLKKHLNLSTAKNVYFTCVYSTLTYCLAVWGGVSLCTRRCNRINTLLHATVVKNLFGVYYDAGECIFRCAGLLKFSDIYKLLVSIYMYKIIQMNMFPTLKNSLSLSTPNHPYPTRNQDSFILPFPHVGRECSDEL